MSEKAAKVARRRPVEVFARQQSRGTQNGSKIANATGQFDDGNGDDESPSWDESHLNEIVPLIPTNIRTHPKLDQEDVETAVDRYADILGVKDREDIEEDCQQSAIDEENSYVVEDDFELQSTISASASSTNAHASLSNTPALLAPSQASQTSIVHEHEPEPEPEPIYHHLPRFRDFHTLTDFVANMIDIANNTDTYVYPDDAHQPFDSHAQAANPQKRYPTKMEVVQELKDVLSINNTTKVGINAVFGVLHRCTGLNVPVKVNPRTGNEIFHWHKYLRNDPRKQLIDVCLNSCCAYVGNLKEALFCPNEACKLPRFRDCYHGGQGNCPNGQSCNPFTTTHTKRTPFMVASYRSIIIKLLDLYKRSLSELPGMFTYDKTRVKMEGFLCDILDGSVPQLNQREMHLRFLDRMVQYARDNGGEILHEFSLCMSAFYDGDKLYNRSDDSLWPLLISIMNCDPCFRTTLGLALFKVIMHNLPMGSGAEQSIMDNCLTAELEQLYDGIVFKFVTKQGERHAVFMQARLIFFHLDTRAQDKVWHVSSAGGMAGCTFCDDCKGLSRPILGTCVYPGVSRFLPENHILKFIGEFKKYQIGYFGEVGENENSKIGKDISALARSIKIRGKGGDHEDSEFDDIEGEGEEDNDQIVDKSSSERMTHTRSKQLPRGKVWFSEEFPWSDVAGACWSPYNDPFTRVFTRVQHEEYLECSRRAGILRQIYLQDCIRLRKPVAKSAPAKWVYSGVHVPLSEWAFSLKSVLRFENAVPDWMHQASNEGDYTMKLVKGERGIDLPSRKLSMAEKCFTFLIDKANPVPWLASKFSQSVADSVFMCLNIPTQCKRDYKFDLPFHHSGFMNSHQKMVFFSVYVSYIFSFTDISMEYRHLFERSASDKCNLLSPCIAISGLRKLQNHVIETIALREKMTPSSEHAFIFHELIEIVHHLGRFGVTKGMMCFFGERMMHAIAKGVPDGGLSYLITVVDRFVSRENAFDHNMLTYTENVKRFLDNQGRFSFKVLKLQGTFIEIALNDWVKGVLFDDIVDFINSQEIEDVVLKSPFMRLYYTHRSLLDYINQSNVGRKRPREFPRFAVWIRELYMCHKNSMFFSCESVKHLVNTVVFDPDQNVHTRVGVMMKTIVNKGRVFMSDFSGIISDLAQFATAGEHTIAAFTRAIVKGVELRGRGQLYTENSLGRDRVQRKLNVTQNPKNNLFLYWHQTFQINSWGKVEDWFIDNPDDPEKKRVTERVLFGQFNYFFRLHIPSDALIDKLSFANMVLRVPSAPDPNRGSHRYIDASSINGSYFHAKQFVVLNYVEATNVAFSALDVHSYPIANPTSGIKESVHKIKSYPLRLSKMSSTEVKRLYMIELHKERLHIKYGSVLEDTDFTKCCEPSVIEHHNKRKGMLH